MVSPGGHGQKEVTVPITLVPVGKTTNLIFLLKFSTAVTALFSSLMLIWISLSGSVSITYAKK